MRAHELLKRARTFYRDCTRLCLVRAHFCTDLHKIWNLSSQHSNWPLYKILWRSELSLVRYSKNNTGLCLLLNFQCILHIFTVLHLQSPQIWIITEWLWHFLEIIYQNAIDSVKIQDLSKLLRCFIGWEISKNIISFTLKHPVIHG